MRRTEAAKSARVHNYAIYITKGITQQIRILAKRYRQPVLVAVADSVEIELINAIKSTRDRELAKIRGRAKK